MQKRLLAEKLANNKNIQFLPKQANIQAILSSHEWDFLTKFHNNWIKIVDFYYLPDFWPVTFFCISLYINFWSLPFYLTQIPRFIYSIYQLPVYAMFF